MRARRGFALLVTTLPVATAIAASTPATADGTSGGGSFTATLTLSGFPCAGPSCAGTLTGIFTGSMSGVDSSTCATPPTPPALPCHAYTVMWPDPTAPSTANLSGSFQYDEACPLAQTAEAGGSYTITGGYVDDDGTIAHDGTITGTFGYSRNGIEFTIDLEVAAVSGNGHVLGTQQFPLGAGAGAFVPEDVATCFGVHTNVSASVTGVGVIPE